MPKNVSNVIVSIFGIIAIIGGLIFAYGVTNNSESATTGILLMAVGFGAIAILKKLGF